MNNLGKCLNTCKLNNIILCNQLVKEKITKKISDLEEKIAKLKNQWLQEKKVIESSAAVKRNIEKIKSQIEQFKKNPTMTAALEAKYSQMLEMQEYAKKNKLYICGGSDYHGTRKPEIKLKVGCNNIHISKNILEWIDKD